MNERVMTGIARPGHRKHHRLIKAEQAITTVVALIPINAVLWCLNYILIVFYFPGP